VQVLALVNHDMSVAGRQAGGDLCGLVGDLKVGPQPPLAQLGDDAVDHLPYLFPLVGA
jgi:hypothetical protein